MKIFVESKAQKDGLRAHLLIGEEEGHLVCRLQEEEGLRSSTTHLLTGSGYYALWHSYMSELARLEKEGWDFKQREMPTISEVQGLHKALTL